jgi:hypothetical protein
MLKLSSVVYSRTGLSPEKEQSDVHIIEITSCGCANHTYFATAENGHVGFYNHENSRFTHLKRVANDNEYGKQFETKSIDAAQALVVERFQRLFPQSAIVTDGPVTFDWLASIGAFGPDEAFPRKSMLIVTKLGVVRWYESEQEGSLEVQFEHSSDSWGHVPMMSRYDTLRFLDALNFFEAITPRAGESE